MFWDQILASLSPYMLLICLTGVTLGILWGAMPGLSTTMAMALLIGLPSVALGAAVRSGRGALPVISTQTQPLFPDSGRGGFLDGKREGSLQSVTTGTGHDRVRLVLRAELKAARADFHGLLDAVPETAWRKAVGSSCTVKEEMGHLARAASFMLRLVKNARTGIG